MAGMSQSERSVVALMEALEDRLLMASSAWAFLAPDGRLLYRPDAQADRIPDFSNVGYRQGAAIPTVAVKATVSAGSGDDAARIQAAIDQVSALPMGSDGFRGAVLLRAGEYQIAGSIHIRASGVVLRGSGASTVLRATGTSTRDLIQVAGSGSRAKVAGTEHQIIEEIVPVGARSFRVDSTAGLKVGDTVIVHRPSTGQWIHDIGMDRLDQPWTAGSKDLNFDRVITRIEGNVITVDAPVTNALEARYGPATIYKYTWSGRIENVGVEYLKGVSDYRSSTDEAHSWEMIRINSAQNAWVRNVIGQHFAYGTVNVGDGGKWVTIRDSQNLDPVSRIEGGRRYSFNVDGQLVLVRNCYSRRGRHDFVNGSTTPGPNVFVDCRADLAYSDSGPHHRWSTGTLFDRVRVQGNQINVQNRGNSGTGHGWAGANMVIWNSYASGGYVVQDPPTAQNWLIGSVGTIKNGTMYVGPHDSGTYDSHGRPVTPGSLYYAQYRDRTVKANLDYREYWLGDIDNTTRDGSADDVYVDPAWRSAVDAVTDQTLAGFDVRTDNRYVPFTFRFSLAPGERIVSASLSVGIRSASSDISTDTIMLDDVNRRISLSSLGWKGFSTSQTTGQVTDLAKYLPLLQDGKLNVCFQDDSIVDWAVLNIQVAPPAKVSVLSAAADAYVRGGSYAARNFGAEDILTTKNDNNPSYVRESFLKFDLSGVNGRVASATLRLTPADAGMDNLLQTLSYVANDAWQEDTVTWNNRPAASGTIANYTVLRGGVVEITLTNYVTLALSGDKVLSLKLWSPRNVGGDGWVNYAGGELILQMA